MIRTAVNIYGYAHDDILTDSLSSLSAVCRNTGEIIGPLFSGILIDTIGFENSTIIVAFLFFTYGLIYFFGSGIILCKSKKYQVCVQQ